MQTILLIQAYKYIFFYDYSNDPATNLLDTSTFKMHDVAYVYFEDAYYIIPAVAAFADKNFQPHECLCMLFPVEKENKVYIDDDDAKSVDSSRSAPPSYGVSVLSRARSMQMRIVDVFLKKRQAAGRMTRNSRRQFFKKFVRTDYFRKSVYSRAIRILEDSAERRPTKNV